MEKIFAIIKIKKKLNYTISDPFSFRAHFVNYPWDGIRNVSPVIFMSMNGRHPYL